MRFTPQFLDEIRSRLSVSQVVARKVALKKAGREYRGLSPFKAEKTPSFFVNDQKGFYHCFASGEHGDIFKFVMATEGLSFTEAVERLAGEAGLQLPKPTPRDAREMHEADTRQRLYELLEFSAKFFEERLKGPDGQEARRYLERRGLKRETIAKFRLGYAPGGRSALKEALAGKGYRAEEMAEAGMLIAGSDIPVPYDRFRDRVMFPITDLRGRIIAFGGRALQKDVPAKYLNSPETPLFHKGSILFNAVGARGAAHDKGRIIAVEGYMDVIALAEAGFGETVAPLGTALTEQQVQLLWRMAPEPILCFDGDSAGLKAAHRAVETVLPHLKPGFSVRFAFLPTGLDPDDLIRAQGPAAFEDVLSKHVKPLFDVLIEKEELAAPGSATPEARAAFDKRVRDLVGRIGDEGVRHQYEAELKETLWQRQRREIRAITGASGRRSPQAAAQRRNNAAPDWRLRARAAQMGVPPPKRTGSPFGPASHALPSPSNELSGLMPTAPQREALILLTLLNHPWLIGEEAEVIADLPFSSPGLVSLRDALLAFVADEKPLDRAVILDHLTSLGLAPVVALVERAITHKGDKFADPEADRAAVETGWRHAVALHRKEGVRRDLAAALEAWQEHGSEDALARICELNALLNRPEAAEAAPTHLESDSQGTALPAPARGTR